MVDVLRLVIVPQYPVKMRYQEWWYYELPKNFIKYFDEVVVVSGYVDEHKRANPDMFSPIDEAIEFEVEQVRQFKEMYGKQFSGKDYLFVADISFAGMFPSILYHKRMGNAYAFCHATSKNRFDYFAGVRKSKWLVEKGYARLFKKVFVATEYHKRKLGWHNVEVVGVPKPPFKTYKEDKEYDILYAGRITRQKFNRKIWQILEKRGYDVRVRLFDSWEEYYKGLSRAKIVLMMSKEETFGYQVLEAVMNNSVVLAPNCCSFSELLDDKYLYYNVNDLIEKVEYFIEHYDEVPRIKGGMLKKIDSWFENIYKVMVYDNNGW